MRKKYELYEIKKYYNEYQQGRGLGVYSGREEAVAAIPYIVPGNSHRLSRLLRGCADGDDTGWSEGWDVWD